VKAHDFTTRAGELLEDRGKDRDQPDGERSMARCVNTFNAMTGHELSVEDGWLFMVYLKHARMRGGYFRRDDYEDAVSYEALMAEEATAESTQNIHAVPNYGIKVTEHGEDEVILTPSGYMSVGDIFDTEVMKR
jgi:hypothetical protein